MAALHLIPSSAAALALLVCVVGCGRPATTSIAPTPAPVAPAPRNRAPLDRPLAIAGTADALPLRARSARPPRGDLAEVYAHAAPATVIVRSRDTLATGVVVAPGVVLTSAHAVHEGTDLEFRRQVQVEYGALGRRDGMVADGERRDAWVVAEDAIRDLALLRVQTPAGVTPVPVAVADPVAGQALVHIGHPSRGALWATQACTLGAVARFEEAESRRDRICADDAPSSRALCSRLRGELPRGLHGATLRTDCSLGPGERGGGLFDAAGNLVGLSVLSQTDSAGAPTSVHVHLQEIRDFLAGLADPSGALPSAPLRAVPSPWPTHYLRADALDQDRDGRWDTLMIESPRRELVILYDLDQDTPDFAPLGGSDAAGQSTIADLVVRRAFDAELALVSRAGQTHVWYDTDGDARLDTIMTIVLRDDAARSYRVDSEGVPHRVEGGTDPQAISASWLPPEARTRFARIFHDHRETAREVPAPLPAILRDGRVLDTDGDARGDALLAERAFIQGLAIDLDGDSLGEATPESLDSILLEGPDLEVSFIRRGAFFWAYYDRDDDGVMDIGLRSAPRSPVVTEAFALPGSAEPPDAASFVGTLILRPCLAGPHQERLAPTLRGYLPDDWVSDPDLCGLPEPLHHAAPRRLDLPAPHGLEGAILGLASPGRSTLLIDLDRFEERGRGRHGEEPHPPPVDVEDPADFGAEIAVLSLPGGVWVYYDTDRDGAWDLVLVRVAGRSGFVRNAFRRTASREAVAPEAMAPEEGAGETSEATPLASYAPDAELAVGPLFRASLFDMRRGSTRLAAQLQELFDELFTADEVESP